MWPCSSTWGANRRQWQQDIDQTRQTFEQIIDRFAITTVTLASPTIAGPALIAEMEDEIRTRMALIQPELDRIKRELLHEVVALAGGV